MPRAVPHILFVLLVAWGGWLVYQYVTESPTAHQLFERRISELSRLPMSVLARAAGAGDHRATVIARGRSYRVRWEITRAQGGQALDQDVLEARVHVDYLDLLPFVDFQLGPSARFTITTTVGGEEHSEFKRSF